MLLKYVGPYEIVEIAATGDLVPSGSVVDVDPALGVSLCDQPSNWVPADQAALDVFDGFCAWVAAHRKYVDPVTGEARWLPIVSAPVEVSPDAATAASTARRKAASTLTGEGAQS